MEAPARVILLDGGMGHEIKSRGISDGSFLAGVLANEDISCGGASVVESIHYDFLLAGCDVLTTNSFVAVPPRMIECGLAVDESSANVKTANLIASSVRRARAAIAQYEQDHPSEDCGTSKRIAGCIPPITECYFAEKVPRIENLIPRYMTIIRALIDNEVDILLAETLSTSREADAVLHALASLQREQQCSKIPHLWITFTIRDDQPKQLRSGEPLLAVSRSIIEMARIHEVRIEAIGVNCSTPPAISIALTELWKELDANGIKCICYANCFEVTTSQWIRSLSNENDSSVKANPRGDEYDENGYLRPDSYAKYASAWANAGATIIGGCCGCSPNHMRAVTLALRAKTSISD